ncbi:hypothetical protein NM208_g4834 [Fusarium decemcellulare]|uniref:Uncharacterized protein n=1 Tax=Fusarium decemcellulare TaxID=57161 RepID=A0ACC1SJJ1_9HYPO|nr:hypothetical protein NM208_g4834 [Fusarium decemcellulare]
MKLFAILSLAIAAHISFALPQRGSGNSASFAGQACTDGTFDGTCDETGRCGLEIPPNELSRQFVDGQCGVDNSETEDQLRDFFGGGGNNDQQDDNNDDGADVASFEGQACTDGTFDGTCDDTGRTMAKTKKNWWKNQRARKIKPVRFDITQLPYDVLYNIFSYFCVHCCSTIDPLSLGTVCHNAQEWTRLPKRRERWWLQARRILFSLTLSCKVLHGAAQDVLYHDLTIGYSDPRLILDLKTGERKDLAAKVQRLSIGSGFLNHLKPLQIRSLILQAAADLGIDFMAAWRRRLVDASKDEIEAWTLKPPPLFYSPTGIPSEPDLPPGSKILYSEILLAFPSPEFIRLQKRWREWSRPRPRNAYGIGRLLTELIAVPIKLLPNLNHLDLRANGTAFLEPSSFKALGISSLPNIRTLEMDEPANFLMNMATGVETMHLRGESDQRPHAPKPQELRNLKTLRVSETRHHRVVFKEVLSACSTDLRTFVYEAGGPFSCAKEEDVTYTDITAAGAAEALKKHRHTLQTLHLDVSLRENIYPPLEEQMSHFTLHDFTALRHILLNLGLLFGDMTFYTTQDCSMTISSRLPRSVESLHLVSEPGQKKPVEQGLIGLAQTKERDPSRFPRLSYIGIAGGNIYICMRGVHEAMAAAGIEYGAEDWARNVKNVFVVEFNYVTALKGALHPRATTTLTQSTPFTMVIPTTYLCRYPLARAIAEIVSRTSQTALTDPDRPFQRSDEPSDHQQVSGIASLIPSRPPTCLPACLTLASKEGADFSPRSPALMTNPKIFILSPSPQPRLPQSPASAPLRIASHHKHPPRSKSRLRRRKAARCRLRRFPPRSVWGEVDSPCPLFQSPSPPPTTPPEVRSPMLSFWIVLSQAVPLPIAVYHPQSPSHVVDRLNTDLFSLQNPFSHASHHSPPLTQMASLLCTSYNYDTGTGSSERASLWETAMKKAEAKHAEEVAKDAAAKKAEEKEAEAEEEDEDEEDEDARLRLEAVVSATRCNYIPKQTTTTMPSKKHQKSTKPVSPAECLGIRVLLILSKAAKQRASSGTTKCRPTSLITQLRANPQREFGACIEAPFSCRCTWGGLPISDGEEHRGQPTPSLTSLIECTVLTCGHLEAQCLRPVHQVGARSRSSSPSPPPPAKKAKTKTHTKDVRLSLFYLVICSVSVLKQL